MNVTFKRIDITDENITKLESARYNAYGMSSLEIPCNESFYANEIKKNKYIIYAAVIEDEIIAACYVSNLYELYIEQLFTIKEYSSLKIGKKLLEFVLSNKKEIEQFFNKKFQYCYFSTRCNSLNNYFEEIGYEELNDVYMRKRI
ncbi:MAG: GNAT family N-acetyltransferase [Firmicutes bacterium]|nr:GNAT family N-acetyltransferase [Bacillota bacterium]